MSTLLDIRKLYTPLQPSVNSSREDVVYTEFLPHASLQNYIYCYWQLKTNSPLNEQFVYRVVADGCIDIFFELENPQNSFVMGFCKKYTEFPLENTFNYIGIRFLPSMFPQLFKVNAKELSNRFEALENIHRHTARFIHTQLHPELKKEQIQSTLDGYFFKWLEQFKFDNDPRLYKALHTILMNFGVLSIEKDVDVGLSSRQLRRVFEYYIGDTPKTFSKVVRFQNILKAKPSTQSLQLNKLFYEKGFYDQAHFIKEFKTFYGVTPSKAFGR